MYGLIEERYEMIRRKISDLSFYNEQVPTLVKLLSYKFFGFPQHPGVSVIERQQAWYFQTSTSFCAVLSSSTYFTSFLPFVVDEEVAGAGFISLRM